MYRYIPIVLQSLVWIPVRLWLRIVFQFTIRGTKHIQNIDTSRGVIFASNHASVMDPLVIAASFPFLSRFFPFFYVALNRSHYMHLKYLRYLTWPLFFKAWGAYPTVLGIKDYEKALKPHIQILNDGGSLVLFLEGHRSKDGTTGPARPGIGYLAEHTNATIVPVAIGGTYHASTRAGLQEGLTTEITFLEPIDTATVLQSAPTDPRERMYYVAHTTLEKITRALAS
ncbi:MAG: lysophospholipid acyltransferase family protein [bacterium]|nr:lysophospholipid acyltransferase family protein [bacterium]